MYRLVLTSMVGLMLSLSGGASALTFKSDGTVVQKDGAVVQKGATEKDEMGWKYQDITKQVVGWTFNKKAALAKRAFDESDKFQSCLRKVGFAKFNELTAVGSVCFSDLISGKFDTPELILSADEAWHAANSKSYEKLALKHWCIAKADFRGNLTSEPFIDVRGKNKFCGSSKKRAHRFQQIPYQAVKEFFSQESQKQTLCSRVKPFASYEEVAALKLSDSNKSALSYFLLARDIGLGCGAAPNDNKSKPVQTASANENSQIKMPAANNNGSGAAEVQMVSGKELSNQRLASEISRLIKSNAELLRQTEFYQLRVKFSFKNFKHKWSDDFDVIVSNKHLFGVMEHSKGKKFIFGKANKSNNFQNLRGYEYYEPNKNKAPISLKFSERGLFIDSIVAGASIDGHVNWNGKWRLKANGVPSYGAYSVTNIKTKFEVSIRSPDAKTANLLLKELSRRRAILKSYSSAKEKMEEYFGSRGVFNAKFGDDLNHLVVELDRFYDEVLALVEKHKAPKTQMASANAGEAAQEEERKAKEAEARRLAKLEEERKAKEAEARRLAKLEEERKAKEAEARRLAKLEEERKAKEAEARRLAEADKSPPKIFAEVVSQDGYDALIRGVITDDTGLQDMAMNGQLLEVDEQGVFETSVYIPRGGELVVIEALDKMGKLSRFELPLERKQVAKLQLASFEKLSPSNRRAKLNQNAVAVIIGVAEYQRTEVPAVYADEDAKFFYDYATLKLGVPEQNIIELVNDKANEIEIALAIENFLKRRIKRNETDVYIFYAGHGLATDDGSEMYLLPYDGAPQLLERTAISRKQLFNDIAASNPKSVTVFLDTCYSGTTRGTETLIASRPIAIKAKQQDIPEGFTVMTAAAGDQTAKPLEEAKHGMFSYFLMKGMEGDADANQDNQITAGELHAFVHQNVIQQSSGSQTPELQGDADRVLVRFQ